MHPHHVYISYASPRVKSRGASSEEKKEEVREKDNEQHRTAYHQLGDDGKEALAEKRAQGSSRDSTMASLSETERKRRSIANVIDYPVLVAEFWQRKTEIVREYLLRDLGIVACFDRMEYQSRGSVHVHSFWWHPNAPPDAFLDVLGNIVMAAEKRKAIADVGGNQNDEDGGESSGGHWTESADMVRALRTVNHLASCSNEIFVYEPGSPGPKLDDADGLPIFKSAAEYPQHLSWSPYDAPGDDEEVEKFEAKKAEDASEVRKAAGQALQASRWHDRNIDASSKYWNEAAREVSGMPHLEKHPACRDVTAEPQPVDPEVDYHDLRQYTGRHTHCTASYCLKDPKQKKEGKKGEKAKGADNSAPKDGGAAQGEKEEKGKEAENSATKDGGAAQGKSENGGQGSAEAKERSGKKKVCRFADNLLVGTDSAFEFHTRIQKPHKFSPLPHTGITNNRFAGSAVHNHQATSSTISASPAASATVRLHVPTTTVMRQKPLRPLVSKHRRIITLTSSRPPKAKRYSGGASMSARGR